MRLSFVFVGVASPDVSFVSVPDAAAAASTAPDFSSTDGVLAFGAGNAFSAGAVNVNDLVVALGNLRHAAEVEARWC